MTHHLVIKLAYDGSSYLGWQKTKEGPSIEGALSSVLEIVFQESLLLRAASRTDRGVHANEQVVDFFCTHSPKDLSKIEVSINQLLPPDIRCLSLTNAPDDEFHPTLSASSKLYRYHITQSKVQKPKFRHTYWHVLSPLNLSLMQEASSLFLGTHDFRGFCNARAGLKDDTIRTVYSIELIQTSTDGELIIDVFGNSFLYKMVRNIIGTIVYIGCGKLDLSSIAHAFSSRKRAHAGITAPAHGLTLWKVNYP